MKYLMREWPICGTILSTVSQWTASIQSCAIMADLDFLKDVNRLSQAFRTIIVSQLKHAKHKLSGIELPISMKPKKEITSNKHVVEKKGNYH